MLNKNNLKIIAEIHPQHHGSMNEIKKNDTSVQNKWC